MAICEVICPINGRARADRALEPAAEAALALGAKLTLLSAVETDLDFEPQAAYLQEKSDILSSRFENLVLRPRVLVEPHAPEAIAAQSNENNVVVMATSTSPLLHDGYVGSAAEHVVRGSHRPTMLVGPHCERSISSLERVLVPIDGSALSEAALPVGEWWADRLGLELEIISVISAHDVETATQALGPQVAGHESLYVKRRAEAYHGTWDVLHRDDPAAAIVDEARGVSLIVMSTHGRSGLRRLVMGSVATSVVRDSLAPVVVVNPPAS